MRTWLLTSTTYATWLPGDSRGSVTSVRDQRPGDPESPSRIEHDRPGDSYEDAIPALHRSAAALAVGEPVALGVEHAETLLTQFQETATHRGWSLLAAAIMWNHFHLVVQVAGDPDPLKVLADFKAYGSRALNRRFGRPQAGTWWTTNGSKRKRADPAAVASAVNYVLYKQPQPLVVWSPGTGRLV
jgi:REP element-mobilizing transposase RayT